MRCIQTASFMALGVLHMAQKQTCSHAEIKPIIFLANNLTNRFKKNKLRFFRDGYVGKHQKDPQTLIDTYCSGYINSYHMNTVGETALISPNQVEEKPAYQFRVAQGVIDIVIDHAI